MRCIKKLVIVSMSFVLLSSTLIGETYANNGLDIGDAAEQVTGNNDIIKSDNTGKSVNDYSVLELPSEKSNSIIIENKENPENELKINVPNNIDLDDPSVTESAEMRTIQEGD